MTRTISAEGSSAKLQIRAAPQRERSVTHNLRRGFVGEVANSHAATARAIRRAQSPHRVRWRNVKLARRHSESDSTHSLRTEFTGQVANSHDATARAIRHAQSPHRIHRPSCKFARPHSESDSTRTISTEGSSANLQIRTAPQRGRFDTHPAECVGEISNSDAATARAPAKLQIRTAPQRERFDTHNLRIGFVDDVANSHGATARAVRHARSPQRVRPPSARPRLRQRIELKAVWFGCVSVSQAA